MNDEVRKTLNGIAVYATILNGINKKFSNLIKNNVRNTFAANEQLFHEIIADIIRVFPVKRGRTELNKLQNKENELYAKIGRLVFEEKDLESIAEISNELKSLQNELALAKEQSSLENDLLELDLGSGILTLKKEIPFVVEKYQNILKNDFYRKILCDLLLTRNKFTHVPHHINAVSSVGGATSCSIGLYYKDKIFSVSTITLTYIIYNLNEVFEELKNYFLKEVNECDNGYKKYPIYKAMKKYDFKRYNKSYTVMPESYILDNSFDELFETVGWD